VTLWDLTSAPAKRWVLQAAGANTFQVSPNGPSWPLPATVARSVSGTWRTARWCRWLATGSQEGKVVLWDTRTGSQLGLPMVGHASGAFSPDGRVPATAAGEATVWDVTSHKQIGAARPMRSEGPHAVAFLPGGSQLAAAAPSGSVLMWDVAPASGGRAPAPSQPAP
jgi:WD40 repeat protein